MEKVLAMLKGGGGTKSSEVVLTRKLEFIAILKGRKKFPHFKRRGAAKSFTLS